ncbi:pyroglutamyl-peptidase I [Alloscardovia theropitheci]|uniref:Pyrrolidone-carboxylate peptidase n=1 Tax=Alloscardovia theropitheci TaxID=2496842 RepID=A0A4R0QYZ5_9BIFI|nr:pyroglutamyl-peptidase I [Alloscardovia theropitheci]TCD55090.1 pyroglutamyl-peptidase I [Alloscardovia theropitheci]
MKILITGFDPFDGEDINPSWEAVRRVPAAMKSFAMQGNVGSRHKEGTEECQIIAYQIPTEFDTSAKLLWEKIQEVKPQIVLCVGQAGGRAGITPERIAINIDDARIPDNRGNQPIDRRIQSDGQPAYFSTLPVKAMVDELKKAGIHSYLSNTAGTFVCNHIMYQALYYADKSVLRSLDENIETYSFQAGFVHVPYIHEQVSDKENTSQLPSMSVDEIVRGLCICISTIIDLYGKEDRHIVGGTEF